MPNNANMAFFLLKQLHRGLSRKDYYVNFRVLKNNPPAFNSQTGKLQKTPADVLYDRNLELSTLPGSWIKLYDTFKDYNEAQYGNILMGVNPRRGQSNTKDGIPQCNALYLDIDETQVYSKEVRLMQLNFLIEYGLAPSLIIDTGHGYHAYWVLTKPVTEIAIAENTIKEMILRSGCRAGGNVSDCTRLMRLPGFWNQKNWESGDQPFCGIVYPENWEELDGNNTLCRRYDIADFNNFPHCKKSQIDDYLKAALQHDPSKGQQYVEFLKNLIAESAKLSEDALLQKNTANAAATIKAETQHGVYMPTLPRIPPLEAIPWPKKRKWLQTYCLRGFDGLTQKDFDSICKTLGIVDEEQRSALSASEFDAKLIYCLIELGYTFSAVEEFWTRPGLALFRSQKSANYLHITYEAMLQSYATAIANRLQGGCDFFYDSNTDITLRKKENTPEEICSGHYKITKVFLDRAATQLDLRDWYLCEVYTKGRPINKLLPRRAFNSTAEFRRALDDNLILLTDKVVTLQKFLLWLINNAKDSQKYSFVSKISYDEHERGFIFPKYVVKKDSIENIATDIPEIKMYFKQADWIKESARPKAELGIDIRSTWSDILRCHMPELVLATLGITASAAIKPVFEQDGHNDFHMPTLNIRGRSTKGKTETIKLLTTLLGLKHGCNLLSVHASQFSLNTLLANLPFMPIIIDEFKVLDSNVLDIDKIRDLSRRNYSGEKITKGRTDLTVVESIVHGSLIVVGEDPLERQGHIAEMTRIFPVTVTQHNIAASLQQYKRLATAPLHLFGPHFYQYILNLDIESEYQKFIQIKTTCNRVLSSTFTELRYRLDHNVAVLAYGCSLWERFMKTLDPGCENIAQYLGRSVERCLGEYLCRWAIEVGLSIVQTETTSVATSSGESQLVAKPTILTINEAVDFIRTISAILITKFDKTNADDLAYRSDSTVYLLQEACWQKYILYKAKFGGHCVRDKAALDPLITSLPFFLGTPDLRTPSGVSRCYALDFEALQKNGLWNAALNNVEIENLSGIDA